MLKFEELGPIVTHMANIIVCTIHEKRASITFDQIDTLVRDVCVLAAMEGKMLGGQEVAALLGAKP